MIKRAYELRDTDIKLACHVAEWAALAAPENQAAQSCVIDIFGKHSEIENSLMGRGILSHAVRCAKKAIAVSKAED